MCKRTLWKKVTKSQFITIIFLFVQSVSWSQENNEISPKAYNKIAQSTVKIICNNGEKTGSGAIVGIGTNGRLVILTACHVVVTYFETDLNIPLTYHQDIKVMVSNELSPLDAIVIEKCVDRADDLALIVTRKPVDSQHTIQYRKNISPGAVIASAGFPGTETLNLTVGRLTRKEKYLVFDARIDKGSSGGPLIDKKGRMVGVSTFLMQSEGDIEGYAIPINTIENQIDLWLKEWNLKKKWRKHRMIYEKPVFIGGAIIIAGGLLSSIISEKGIQEGQFPVPPGRPSNN